MYAVISDRGRQHCVQEGETVLLDHHDAEPGQTIEFDRILLIGRAETSPLVGQPTVEGAKVVANVLEDFRMKKIVVGTYKRRKNFRRHKGHRQWMTKVRITQIITPGGPDPEESAPSESS